MMGNPGSRDAKPAMKWFLNVWMARSAALARWTWGGRDVSEDRWRQLVVAYVEVWGEASTREEEMDGVHDVAPFRGVA